MISAVLVEGYMDAIAVARAGIVNVIASCGTSLADPQIKLLGRFTRRVVVNYDPDIAGQAATERSLTLLLEKEFDVRVLALPARLRSGQISKGARRRSLQEAVDSSSSVPGLFDWPRQTDGSNDCDGRVLALNFLMPYVQRLPNRLLRSEWATRIASELHVDEPVLREALRRAATERRSEVKPKAELLGPSVKGAERRLIHMLAEANGFREKLAQEIVSSGLHRGLETEKIFELLIAKSGEPSDPSTFAEALDERDRRVLFEIFFESFSEHTWEEAESCLGVLRSRRVEQELAELQKQLESKPPTAEIRRIITRRLELQKLLAGQ